MLKQHENVLPDVSVSLTGRRNTVKFVENTELICPSKEMDIKKCAI